MNRSLATRRSGGRGGRGGRRDDSAAYKGRVFWKLLKDKDAEVSNVHQAKRFLEGIETFDSKVDFLSKLDDQRTFGMQRIQDVLSFIDSSSTVEALLIPLLRAVINQETSRPLYRSLRDKVLMAIFSVPELMNMLSICGAVSDLEQPSALIMCSFLLATAKAFVEARMSDPIADLARSLRERGDVPEANILCALLLTDEVSQQMVDKPSTDSSNAACWVTDSVPPGDRHDNDHRNYRNIKIIPTVQELTSVRPPWLPLASGENAMIQDPGTRLLDANFRLLREDAVRVMKENIEQQARAWHNARVVGLDNGGKGTRGKLAFIVQCDSRRGGNPDWKRSRALMHGSVVALCRDGVPVRMGTICVREADAPGEWLNAQGGPKIGIVFESKDAFDESVEEMLRNSSMNEIVCKLCAQLAARGPDDDTVTLLNQLDGFKVQLMVYELVEASKSFFSYHPILEALQSMEGVPLSEEIVATQPFEGGRPSYLPNIVKMPPDDCFNGYECDLGSLSTEDLVEQTSLDRSQAESLRHALTSRVALIQGPPGTGKTFIGALVARMIRQNSDESILCICFTNHALDQFLEHMVSAGEKKVVRIGGRSKSSSLAKYNIRELAQHKARLAPNEVRRLRQLDAQLHEQRRVINESIGVIKEPVKWNSPCGGVKKLLSCDNPEQYCFLVAQQGDDDGFELLGPNGKKLKEDFLWDCWRKGEGLPMWMRPLMEGCSDKLEQFWAIPYNMRVAMMEDWRRQILRYDTGKLHTAVTLLEGLNKEKQDLLQDKDLQILRDARVIGATTTGAAQYRSILSAKSAGVVIVEEAGEVLEAHVLTTLSESTHSSDETKHLIMIGDHKQLRPKVESHGLTTVSGSGLELDRSLFERLVLSGLPSISLQVQHRMRPSISEFVRVQTYPYLLDHESVFQYPDVKGSKRNVLFIDHRHLEDGGHSEDDYGSSKTKSNDYEAELCVEITRFFLLQGYRPDQIVILTPYLGQLRKLLLLMRTKLAEVTAYVNENDQRELENMFETEGADATSNPEGQQGNRTVRCSSIDNFQGEEADVIVVSLVRSNERGAIGFLKEAQRVNVLLSRAKHGMFLIGNSSTLLQKESGRLVWEGILDQMATNDQLLSGLPTFCQNHTEDEQILLCQPIDFRTHRPNGGCTRRCTYRMKCGHVCPKTCHPIDKDHTLAQNDCFEPCKRFPPECTNRHACPKLCNEPCGPCHALVGPVTLVCGHVHENPRCHDVRNSEAIAALSMKCNETVTHQFRGCGHKTETSCSNSRAKEPVCPAVCNITMPCGHPCQNACGRCNGEHRCKEVCERHLFCGHLCGRPCHGAFPCEPCTRKCPRSCVHSKCASVCNAPCPSCVEECDWFCEHRGQCPVVCGAPCTRLPCDERCSKDLSCGHRCPGVCGEECPDQSFCQECGLEERKENVVDVVCFTKYRDHDVDEDPIIFLPCGHFFAKSTLDGHLDIREAYSCDGEGNFVGLRSLRGSNITEKPKCCPDCRSPIFSVRRYGRLLRFSELRSLERKHLMQIDRILAGLAARKNKGKAGKNKDKASDIKSLKDLEETIRKSPMRVVFEACGGCDDIEVSPPPPRPLIQMLELLANIHADNVEKVGDRSYTEAKGTFVRAIEVADDSRSTRSGALLRLGLVSFLSKWKETDQKLRALIYPHLDWIISQGASFGDLVERARDIRHRLSEEFKREQIALVVAAVNIGEAGYNYGTSPSDHWYECPNGHPFFIGDCGRAMQTSRCIECGEPVGGGGHRLLESNSTASGYVRDAATGRRN